MNEIVDASGTNSDTIELYLASFIRSGLIETDDGPSYIITGKGLEALGNLRLLRIFISDHGSR